MNYLDRFTALSRLLAEHRCLWQQSHFTQANQHWQQVYPGLFDSLLALPDQQVDSYYRQMNGVLDLLLSHIPDLAELTSLTTFPQVQDKSELPARLATDVPGRKWAQIEAFVAALPESQNTQQVVDWCAGKSHLGRAVAVKQRKHLWAIERDSLLCEAGKALSERWLDKAAFTPMDVLCNSVPFTPQDQVIALHACGDLHRKLLRDWQQSASPLLALAPCCYHKWINAGYEPMSTAGRAQDLHLTKEQVQLAVQEWVTASQREQRQSEQMMQYRLAFDLLQRHLRGEDSYLPTPSLPYSILAQGGEAVLRTLCAHKGLTPPAELDWQEFVHKGLQRFQVYRRLQLLNHSFRRALETWLVLDLALSLEEQGAEVKVVTFCDRALSPRNLMIQAVRQSD